MTEEKKENKETKAKEETKKNILNDVKNDSASFSKDEIEKGKGMGVLSYIIPLIPFFAEKENKFVRYHAKQGMNLLILSIVYSVLYSILTSIIKVKGDCGYGYWADLASDYGVTCNVTPIWVTLPLSLVGVAISVLCIIGIINVVQGQAKELPIVNKIKIFK